MTWFLLAALAAPLAADDAVLRSLELSRAVAVAAASAQSAQGETRATALFRTDPLVQGRWAAVGDLHGVSVTQPLSVTGEGMAAHRAAKAKKNQADSSMARTRLEIAAATRVSWATAVEARQRVELAVSALDLAGRLREGAEARERAGDGSLLEARLARLQESEARSTWMVALATEAERLAELSVWTGVSVSELELPSDPLESMGVAQLAPAPRSDLEAARHAVDAAEARLAEERSGVVPPVRMGAFYEQEGDELRVGPSVGVTVPLWSRNADGRATARGDVDVALARVAERERIVDAERSATASLLTALDGIDDALDLQAEAQAALKAVGIGFDRGELDLLTAGLLRQQIIEGQRAWLEGRRVQAEARIAAALAHEDSRLLGP